MTVAEHGALGGDSTVSPAVTSWRTSTAVRVFGVALAVGAELSTPPLGGALPVLTAVVLVAGVAAALEWGAFSRSMMWIVGGEAILVSILLGLVESHPGLLVYLAVPPIVAGTRHGFLAAINVSLVSAIATGATLATTPGGVDSERVAASALWILIGLGVGLLAGWQSRSLRTLNARVAPFAAANDLMSQLHAMATQGGLGLDSTSLAVELQSSLRESTGAERSAVFVHDQTGTSVLLASHGETTDLRDVHGTDQPLPRDSVLARIPLRGTNQLLGEVVLARTSPWSAELRSRALALADEFSLRLDTALLFDDVRHMTRAEERNRIAREMHDGVAQEIVALGYVVDEIESVSNQPETKELAAALREEVSRIVSEIRFSIFDLRQHVGSGSLSAALSEYLQAIAGTSCLQVHLIVDESGTPLSAKTQTEVLRVAQEAITNVRKHAGAANLWVTWVTDGRHHVLQVEDDGNGNAGPRNNHWGLQTMRERAATIGAELTVTPRPEGGTTVLLRTASDTPTAEGDR